MAKNKSKNKRSPLKVLANIALGSVITVGSLAGAFFAIPGLQSKIADSLIDKSPIHQNVIDENEDLKEQNNEKEKQIKVLTSDIQTKADTITGLNLQLTNVKKEKSGLELSLSNMVSDKDTMLAQIKEKNGKIDGYTTIISNLNSQLTTATNERDDIQSQLNSSLEDNDELVAKLNEKNNEINSLNSVINSLTIQIDALEAIKEDYESKYLASLNEIDSLKAQIESKDSEIEILNKKIVSLNEQIVLLQTELNSMQASSTCTINYDRTDYTYTPDGIGYIWFRANNEYLANYDFSYNSYSKSAFLNRMQSKFFYGLNRLDYYNLSIDSINYYTTFYKESGAYIDDSTNFDFMIVDGAGNEITNFDNLTNKINVGLNIDNFVCEKNKDDDRYYISSIRARLIVLFEYQMQTAYSNENSTLVLSDNNTFNYNGITGNYEKVYSEIRLTTNDGTIMNAYLTSDYSIAIDNDLMLSENAHNIRSSILGEGKISLNPSCAKLAGDTVEFTCEASNGYLLKSVTVTDANGNILPTKLSNGVYSFTMPEVDAKVMVQYELYTLTFNANYTHYFDEVNGEGAKTTQVIFNDNGTMTILNKDINSQVISSYNGVYSIDENNITVTIPSTETGNYELTMHFEIVDENVIVNVDNNMTYSCS